MPRLIETKMLVVEKNFTPTPERSAVGFGSLRANEILVIRTGRESVCLRDVAGGSVRERTVKLPQGAIENLIALCRDTDKLSRADCHAAGQYITGHSRTLEQINLRHYTVKEVRLEYQEAGELYSMQDNKGVYRHTVVGVNSPYSLSVLGSGGSLVLARTEHVLRAYKCQRLAKLSRTRVQG